MIENKNVEAPKRNNIDLSEERKALIRKARVTRQSQDNIMVGNVKAKITNNVVLEAKASYYEALAKYNNKRVTLTPSMKDTFKSVGKESVNAIKNAFASQDDVGSQTVGGIITASVTTAKALSTTKRATSAIASSVKNAPSTVKNAKENIVKIGNKAYQIYGTADKIYLTVKQSAPLIKGGFVPTKNALVTNALKNGLHKTANIKRIIELSKKIKKVFKTSKDITQGTVKTFKYTVKIVKTIAIDQKLKGNITKSVLKQARNKAKPYLNKAKLQSLNVLNSASKSATKNMVQGGTYAVKRVIPKGIKGAGSIVGNVGSIMASSNDDMVRGIGYSTMIGKYTVKTATSTTKHTVKFVKTSPTKINNGIKKVKTATKKTVKTAKKVKTATKQTAKATYKTTKNIIKIVASAVRHAAALAIRVTASASTPLIIIIAGALVITFVIVAIGSAGGTLGYYLSGEFIFGGDDNDESSTQQVVTTDVRTYLLEDENGLKHQRELYISSATNTISTFFVQKGGDYNKVMISAENESSYKAVLHPSDVKESLEDVFWDTEHLYDIIQPLFYVRILVECNLEPTYDQAERILGEITDSLFQLEHFEGNIERCNVPHSCGSSHALEECINSKEVIHTAYTCDECCQKKCEGHKKYVCNKANTYNHVCTDDCQFKNVIEYCEGCVFDKCNGIEICEGHSLYYCIFALRNMDDFVEIYVDNPIADLEAKGNDRTPEENNRLSTLKDYRDIIVEYIKMYSP